MLKLQNINKSFGDLHVLKGIDLEIMENKTTVIIGSSGSGKSTLLRCINMLASPDSGKMEFDGITLDFSSRIDKSQEAQFRSKTGMVFQNFNLFPHKTAIQNIMIAPMEIKGVSKEKAHENALKLLQQVGLEDKMDVYPHELSGGQQQRVAIARALAMEPKIMLFDEPTSALDPEIEQEILKLISNVTHDQFTNILVTHNMNFAKEISDRIIFMEDGGILAEGRYEELINSDNERIRQFLNTISKG